jgi:hypothetical protein
MPHASTERSRARPRRWLTTLFPSVVQGRQCGVERQCGYRHGLADCNGDGRERHDRNSHQLHGFEEPGRGSGVPAPDGSCSGSLFQLHPQRVAEHAEPSGAVVLAKNAIMNAHGVGSALAPPSWGTPSSERRSWERRMRSCNPRSSSAQTNCSCNRMNQWMKPACAAAACVLVALVLFSQQGKSPKEALNSRT